MGGRFRWDKRYLYWGITAFCVIVASILVFLGVSHWRSGLALVELVLSKLMPFVYGLLMAYLLNKPMMFFEKHLFGGLRGKTPERAARRRRTLSVLLIMALTLLVLGGILALILPQIYTSVESLIIRLPGYFETAMDWIQRFLEGSPDIESIALGILGSVEENLTEWLRTTLLTQVNVVLTGLTSGVIGVIRELLNFLIGFVVAVYALYHKERFVAQVRKTFYAVLRPRWASYLINGMRFIDVTCGSFITSKLIDSLIVGVVCWIVTSIAQIPYAVLISVIVGITNVIPFFGPLIGGVPAALLVLLENPGKCFAFVIIIVIIQQLDGNVLFPRLQGSRQGLSGFWILFSILLFGGLFGFWGFLFGVPLFSVIYHAAKLLARSRLAARGLPTDTEAYHDDISISGPDAESPDDA